MPEVVELAKLYLEWRQTASAEARRKIWERMLAMHAEQQFTIGVVSGVPQPVVAGVKLRNVPDKGLYNWDPGAFFGIYRPDTFWME
jgi:peptide/nickel transport system substrate-binding protein